MRYDQAVGQVADMGLLMLWPVVMGALIWYVFIHRPAARRRAYRDDPAQPWNVTMRLTQENIDRAEAEYLAHYQPVPKVPQSSS